jgi:membrane protein insertase Oxa1/YidC/SpoIIIJ
VLLLSLVAVALSIYTALNGGNIIRLETGLESDARVSFVGYIIFPVFFVGIAYLGNLLVDGLGWHVVFGLFGFFCVYGLHASKTNNEMLCTAQRKKRALTMQISLTAFSFFFLRFYATIPQNNSLQSSICLRRKSQKN